MLVAVLLAACTSSGGKGNSTSAVLTFTSFNPFSGADAAFGPEMVVACNAAVALINQDAGVLGHQATCRQSDTHGDPADAVAAANQMLATTGNLVGILGPSSDEALSTVPIFNSSKIPMFADTGQAAFDHSNYEYFWRLSPADDVKGFAMALWAYQQGYTRAAAIFGRDVGSQSNVPTLVSAFTKLGGQVVSNQPLMLDQSSYRSEIVRMLAAKPQVIFTEVDPQTAATFLSELQQLNGSLLPIIGTETTLEAPWLRAVTQAVGSNTLSQSFAAVEPYAPTSGPAYETFNSSLRLVKGVDATDLALYSTDPYAMGYYDSITIMALAMIGAKSTDPTKFNGAIVSVTAPGSGKVVVSSFAEGEKALAAGKQIQYVGAAGPVVFDTWHSSTGAFEIAGYVSAGKVRNLGSVSAAQIAALSG